MHVVQEFNAGTVYLLIVLDENCFHTLSLSNTIGMGINERIVHALRPPGGGGGGALRYRGGRILVTYFAEEGVFFEDLRMSAIL